MVACAKNAGAKTRYRGLRANYRNTSTRRDTMRQRRRGWRSVTGQWRGSVDVVCLNWAFKQTKM